MLAADEDHPLHLKLECENANAGERRSEAANVVGVARGDHRCVELQGGRNDERIHRMSR
jgi:hypothetical protein